MRLRCRLGCWGCCVPLWRLGPVLLGIDDLQWLDADSARVLEFALRRMTMEPVGVVAASRPPGPGHVQLRLERAVGGQPPHTVVLGPMPVGELHRLVYARFGRWLPGPVLRRVHVASGEIRSSPWRCPGR
jgi:hypothetical protein